MAKRGTLYRCHLFSFSGPQTQGVRSRWTYDLVPVNDFELRSGTDVELLVEIDHSARLVLDPDVRVRFDILEEDYLLTGGADDAVLALVGTGAAAPESDFKWEARETIFYELDEDTDTLAWIRRFVTDHAQAYRSTVLVLEQPAAEGFRYTIVTWWTAERLEDYATSELYFIVNVDDKFDDQSDTVDVSPDRWNPDEGDPRVWAPFVSERRIHELLTTSITDWSVTPAEAREALAMLSRLGAEDRLQVTMLMRQNRTWAKLEEKLGESDPVLYSQFLDMARMLDPNMGYLVPFDHVGVLVSAGSSAMPTHGGFMRKEYEEFLREHPQAAEGIRRHAIDGAQYGDRYQDRIFVDPSSLSDSDVEMLGEEALWQLTRANVPSDDLDHRGRIHQIPTVGTIAIGGLAPVDAANAIARKLFADEMLRSPSVVIYIMSRGASYIGHGKIGTGNRIPVFRSTFVPDPNLPAVKRANRLADYHAYLGPVRDTDPRVVSAVLWYYNWLAEHLGEPIFFDKNPEDLFAEALEAGFKPPPQRPLEPYLRFARLMDERENTASPEEKSRILRSSLAYWAWIDAHRDESVLRANDPGKVWGQGYNRAVQEDIQKEQLRLREERLEKQRQLDLPLIDKTLGQAIDFVIHNVYAAREPYVVEGVEEDEGFLGFFAEKRGVGYLVMPSETEKELRSAIGGAYLDDIFSRMTQPGFKDVDIRRDFMTWLADRQHMDDALSTAMTYPYTERYEFAVDLSAFQTAVEIGIGFVPIVGQIVGAIEVIGGTSLFGRPMSTVERGITAAAILLPAVAKITRVGGGLMHASEIVSTYKLTGREAQAVYRSCLPIAEGTRGNRLLREAAEDIKAGRQITDPARIRALENLIKEMKLTDRATARALTIPPPPELAGNALAKEDTAVTLIKGVFGEQTGAYRALSTESRTAVRGAIRSESALFRRAMVAETHEGHARYVNELIKQMNLYGMTLDQQRILREALNGLNLQHRTALNEAVRALSRERIAAVGDGGRVTGQGGLMNTRYSDRISKAEQLHRAASDARVRRRLAAKISRLRREQRRLQGWLDRGEFDLQEFQRMISEEPSLRRLMESGGEDMLLQHWINFRARPSGRALVSTFPEYVERMQGQFVGLLGEIEVGFRVSGDWILIKVPDDMVTIPGTDLIAISRRGGPVRFIDNKAFTSTEVEAVDALTRNFTRNAAADLEQLGRIAGDMDLPTHFRLAQNRITRANTAIQARIQGLTPDQIASPAVQRDIAAILQQESIERVVTNAAGKVTDISPDLRAMGIDLWDLN